MSAVACSGPDVPVVENGGAGKASGSAANEDGGSQSKGGTSSTSGTKAMGGLTGTGGDMGGRDAAGGTIGAGGDDSSLGGTGSGCQGQAPLCFGSDVQKCCGNDPAGSATCENGEWSCSGAAAPGCNGTQCTDQFDCGTRLQCERSKTYCAVTPVSAGAADYACVAIPNDCLAAGASLCSCLKEDTCSDCTEEFGAVTLTCPP
jgi:hypothetical protein